MSDTVSILKRLRRIEGQIKGIQKMIEAEQFCGDILVQVSAARSALNNVGGLVLENYMDNCLKGYINGETSEEELDKLIKIMLQYTK